MKNTLRRSNGWFALPLLCAALARSEFTAAVEWAQYLGPNRDSTSTEVIRTNWGAEPPRVVWKTALSAGLSSLTISGGRVFTQGRRTLSGRQEEFCLALEANTGKELWATPVGLAQYDGGVGNDDGPRSTPSAEGDRVFVYASYLRLVCLRASDGQEIWRKDLQRDFGGAIIPWQNAMSPLLVGDLVIVNSNGRSGEHILAFKKGDGALAWKGHSDGLTHSSPVLAEVGGTRQVIFFAQTGLVAVAPETGQALWRHPLNYNFTSVAATPVVMGDRVYVSRGYPTSIARAQAGAVVVKINSSGSGFSASPVWSKPNQLMNHWSTPVHYNGYIYGMFGMSTLNFQCIDANDGTVKWSRTGFGDGSVLAVNGQILALGDEGQLVLVAADPSAYREIARIQPITGKCWNSPSLSDGKIYYRSTLEAVAIDVSAAAKPPLRIEVAKNQAGQIELRVGTEDSTPLDAGRAAQISVYATSDLPAAPSGWTRVTDSPVLSNGKLLLLNPEGVPHPRRFFRTEERP